MAIVTKGQEMELMLSEGLTGEVGHDGPVLEKLLRDFAGGIRQNMENEVNVGVGSVFWRWGRWLTKRFHATLGC